MDKSGATLARDYFKLKLPEHVNTLFEYIEDHDLWRHELPESKLFAAGTWRKPPVRAHQCTHRARQWTRARTCARSGPPAVCVCVCGGGGGGGRASCVHCTP